jgi:hypothetical protein
MPAPGSRWSPWAIEIKPVPGFSSSRAFRLPGLSVLRALHRPGAFGSPGNASSRAAHCPECFVLPAFVHHPHGAEQGGVLQRERTPVGWIEGYCAELNLDTIQRICRMSPIPVDSKRLSPAPCAFLFLIDLPPEPDYPTTRIQILEIVCILVNSTRGKLP